MSAFNDFMSQTDKLTPKQKEILVFLYRFRFLNRHHIQQILNHKDHRRINTWLKYLSKKNFLGRIYLKKFGSITIPAIYYLKTKSREVLKTYRPFSIILIKFKKSVNQYINTILLNNLINSVKII
jgi:hypothetical protein